MVARAVADLGLRRGGGGGADVPSSGIRSPADPKVPPLYYHFWLTDLKILLKAPLALIYTNFEGGARAKKTRFFGRNFPKSA